MKHRIAKLAFWAALLGMCASLWMHHWPALLIFSVMLVLTAVYREHIESAAEDKDIHYCPRFTTYTVCGAENVTATHDRELVTCTDCLIPEARRDNP